MLYNKQTQTYEDLDLLLETEKNCNNIISGKHNPYTQYSSNHRLIVYEGGQVKLKTKLKWKTFQITAFN